MSQLQRVAPDDRSARWPRSHADVHQATSTMREGCRELAAGRREDVAE